MIRKLLQLCKQSWNSELSYKKYCYAELFTTMVKRSHWFYFFTSGLHLRGIFTSPGLSPAPSRSLGNVSQSLLYSNVFASPKFWKFLICPSHAGVFSGFNPVHPEFIMKPVDPLLSASIAITLEQSIFYEFYTFHLLKFQEKPNGTLLSTHKQSTQ